MVPGQQTNRLDADESIFFFRELEHIKTKTYDIKFPELKARSLIPVSFDAGPGATTITYRQYSQQGVAKIISSYAKDLPRADVSAKEFHSPIKSLGDSFGYNIQEIRSARMAGVPLEQRKATAARRGMALAENRIAFFGDVESGLPGLLSNPNIQSYQVPTDGAGSSALWSAKTALQIMRDLSGMVTQVIDVTLGIEMPDTLVLPQGKWSFLTTQLIPNTSVTVLEFWLKSNPSVKNVEWVNDLKGAGAAGTDRIMVYKRDPDHLTLEVPQDFEQFAPEQEGLEWKVACHQRIGGTIVYYPLAVCFADGV